MSPLYQASLDMDANYKILGGGLPFFVSKRITFTGGTADTIGDFDGDLNPFPIFTVTGDVQLNVVGICKTDLVGANATLEVGVVGNTAILLPQITATAFDVNMSYDYVSVAGNPGLAPGVLDHHHTLGGGLDVIGTVATANITAGVFDVHCFWRPLSEDGLIVAA